MPEIRRNDPTPEELEFLEAMTRLRDNQYFQLLIDEVLKAREVFRVNLASNISLTGGAHAEPVNQRYIDYQRGFWNGAVYAVSQFPKQKAKTWDRFVAESVKESDSA